MNPQATTAVIFLIAYAGIAAGGVPGLAIDRTGISLLGAIAMLATGALTPGEATGAVEISTILLLYSLMIVSAQLRLGGFYTKVSLSISAKGRSPEALLFVLMGASALLSSVLVNDIICFAFTPVICATLRTAALNPVPFLLGLMCASNIGSAATIIGNPQNIIIGQAGDLDFGSFILFCAPPSMVSLVLAYLVIVLAYRGRWEGVSGAEGGVEAPYDAWQTKKGLVLAAALVLMFFTPVPREVSAITAAGVLLCSRRIKTREILGLVDWHLLTLFAALFIVVEGAVKHGVAGMPLFFLEGLGYDINDTLTLSVVTAALSNILSNVPAVMLLLKNIDLGDTRNLYLLALASTYAGNLLTIGSIANLITIEQAKAWNVHVGFREHLKVGVPVTVLSIATALLWMRLVGFLI